MPPFPPGSPPLPPPPPPPKTASPLLSSSSSAAVAASAASPVVFAVTPDGKRVRDDDVDLHSPSSLRLRRSPAGSLSPPSPASSSRCMAPSAFLETTLVEPWWRAHTTNDTIANLRRHQSDFRLSSRRSIDGFGNGDDDSDSLDDEEEQPLVPPKRPRPYLKALSLVLMSAAVVGPWASLNHFPAVDPVLRSFVLWTLLFNAGFAYVSVCVAGRPSFFRGRHGGFRDILAVNLVSPFLFHIGFEWLAELLWASPLAYVAFSVPFVGTLHLSYLIQLCPNSVGRSLSAKHLSQPCSVTALIAFGVKLVVFVILILLHTQYLVASGTLLSAVTTYAVVVSVLAFITYAVNDRYYLHAHHWFTGILMTPLSHLGSPVLSLAAVGVCGAQFVEGAAKWSCAPLWHRR